MIRRLAFLAFGAALAGCALILGIDDKPVRQSAVDGGAAASLDLCAHQQPPPAEGTDDDPDVAQQATYIIAARGFDFAPAPGHTLGFDLDDTCTCDLSSSRHDAGASCVSTVSRNCDDDAGVDDALGALSYIKLLSGVAPGSEGASQTAGIECGRSTVLAVISKYNGRANDADVGFSLVLSPGLQTPHEMGEAPSSCNSGPDSGTALPVVYTPRWDGTDQWSSDTTFVIDNSLAPTEVISGYVRDFTLVARSDEGSPPLRLPFGPIVGEVAGAIVRAHLVPAAGGKVAIDDGEIDGRITTASLLGAISNIPLGGKAGYICPNSANAALYDNARSSVCAARDVLVNPLADFTGAPCDAVSAAIRIFGDPAQMLKPIPVFDGGASPCAGLTLSCD